MAYGDVPNGTRDGKAPSIFKPGWELVLKDKTTLFVRETMTFSVIGRP